MHQGRGRVPVAFSSCQAAAGLRGEVSGSAPAPRAHQSAAPPSLKRKRRMEGWMKVPVCSWSGASASSGCSHRHVGTYFPPIGVTSLYEAMTFPGPDQPLVNVKEVQNESESSRKASTLLLSSQRTQTDTESHVKSRLITFLSRFIVRK